LIYLALIGGALLLALYVQQRVFNAERRDWVKERGTFATERKEWVAERRDLNNRIQVPEAAPFMQDEDKPSLQHVPFDDDEAFQAAMEELQGEADPEWP
jgi:hypothetical protein